MWHLYPGVGGEGEKNVKWTSTWKDHLQSAMQEQNLGNKTVHEGATLVMVVNQAMTWMTGRNRPKEYLRGRVLQAEEPANAKVWGWDKAAGLTWPIGH